MKTLRLTIKKQWFDMILSGEKKEEYREIKEYWCERLVRFNKDLEFAVYQEFISDARNPTVCHSGVDEMLSFFDASLARYDLVEFTNGYGKDKPQVTLECRGVEIGKGNPEWGAPEEDVFIIKLGKEVCRSNME